MTEVVTGFGIKGVSAEKVASDACDEAERYLRSDVPVGTHLADQLLVPMALAGGGTVPDVDADRAHADQCRRRSSGFWMCRLRSRPKPTMCLESRLDPGRKQDS